MKFCLKPWFVDSIWHLSFKSEATGWDISFQTYNVVPDDSDVIVACRNGDLGMVQRLFAEHKASPSDVTSDGRTLLEVTF